MAVRCSIQFVASGVRQTALPGVISVCVMTVRPGQIQRVRCYLQEVGRWTENIENLARNRFIYFQSTPPSSIID